ncbi:MAG: MG2 domain-containing protein [Acidobacteria bacterium]|nr:MG2 domain-containing protein [Acidobacteriota bacterium]
MAVFVLSTTRGQGNLNQDNTEKKGLDFRISEGKQVQQPRQQISRPATKPLPELAVQNLFKRLLPIKSESNDEKVFSLRDRTLPPPRTGQTISDPFPPIDHRSLPEELSSGPLEVLRFTPEGEVPLAPHLSVTFSQPMVPVTSISELAAGDLPIELSPQPRGKWRWIGSRTLLFEPEDRFPMATEYTVEIPAGTKSATGGTLADVKKWTFSTAPLDVVTSHPSGESAPRNPIIFIEFDQRIDPETTLRYISLSANDRNWPLRLATAEEVKTDDKVRELVSKAKKDRWLAIRVAATPREIGDQILPAGTIFTVSLEKGATSAEGPRQTRDKQKFIFGTLGPLRAVDFTCGFPPRNVNCSPWIPWEIRFSNPLSSDVDSSKIKIEPALEGVKVHRNYRGNLIIEGKSDPRINYRIALDASIKDIFGQTLGENVTLNIGVGAMSPRIYIPGDGFVILDPAAKKRISIYSVNHQSLKVSLYAVPPENYGKVRTALGGSFRSVGGLVNSSEIEHLVFSEKIEIDAKQDELVGTPIDLQPAFKDGLGHALLIVESMVSGKSESDKQVFATWIQSTGIGLDTYADDDQLLGWATSLQDGKPIEGVQLELHKAAPSAESVGRSIGKTDADGMAKIELEIGNIPKFLIARNGIDVALLPEHTYPTYGINDWSKQRADDFLLWHVFDDRDVYRPGEEVHIKGWIRRTSDSPRGDVTLPAGAARLVNYMVQDSLSNELGKGTVKVNALGGFDFSFKVPIDANLGNTDLTLVAEGEGRIISDSRHIHNIQIQEFRRPEFELKMTAGEGPHFVGEHADLMVRASYYAGGALPDTEVIWTVDSRETNYIPPNRRDFTFGKWIPWWEYSRGDFEHENTKEFIGRTNKAGTHSLQLDFDSVNPPRPKYLAAMVVLQDVNRQVISESTGFIVHPAELYVGLRSSRSFVERGEPLIVESIVTDVDGKAIPDREIKLRAVLLQGVYENRKWHEREINPQECIVRSTVQPVICRFETKDGGGEYLINASIIDDKKRRNEGEMRLWVSKDRIILPIDRSNVREGLTLIPNKENYQPGETAEILVQSSFVPAEGIVTFRRSGLLMTERFTMNSATHTLRVQIKDEYLPNIIVGVDLVGAAIRTDDDGKPLEQLPRCPAFASGTVNLSISLLKRRLTVKATPRENALSPGGTTFVDVEVRDANGKPVKDSELALTVVDEAVLTLMNYQLVDPLISFYPERKDGVSSHNFRSNILHVRPDELITQNGEKQLKWGLSGVKVKLATVNPYSISNPGEPIMLTTSLRIAQIRTRIDFNPLATFAASVLTDINGRASVKIKLPDNLTRYRIMAVAVAGEKQFGTAESAITARLPLMVRPSPPRFLNFGDKFELPVVVQNQTNKQMQVDLAVRASNAKLTRGNGRRVTVPANDRVEVRFPVTTIRPGTARFQIAGASAKWSDAAEVSLPVWTPATTEAFATYGEVDAGSLIQPVKAPSDAIRQFGGLEITTSSTQLQALTDAVIYLTSYPFECAEQIAARVLAISALRDVLAAFDAGGLPKTDELIDLINRDIARLRGLQNSDGGFGFWRPDDMSWPYLSIYVAHALQRAQAKGFHVPPEMLNFSRDYLRDIEKNIPKWYGAEEKKFLAAYSLYVRTLMDERDGSGAREQIEKAGGVENMPLDALGFLLPVLSGDPKSQAEVAAIRRHFSIRVEETAATAHFTTSYKDGAHLLLHSNRRADAIILDALIGDDPKNDLIPKLVRGLLTHRKQGRWENTQENAFVLLALDRYFTTYERVTPDFVARAWLGESYAGGHEFRGRTTEPHQVDVPMSYLMSQRSSQNLVLSKKGTGRMYFRIGMKYAPENLQLNPADRGFTVTRVYEAIDDPNDVRREEDGTWRIKAGAQVRVRLTMVTQARRYHVALVDPLPAGFEARNPVLATTGVIPQDPEERSSEDWWYRYRHWFEHQNMRDERIEAFTSNLWEGVYNYSYVARATTPGIFVVPPPKAEEMYHPETFGRGATDRVVIE